MDRSCLGSRWRAGALQILAEGPEHGQRLADGAGLVHKESVDNGEFTRKCRSVHRLCLCPGRETCRTRRLRQRIGSTLRAPQQQSAAQAYRSDPGQEEPAECGNGSEMDCNGHRCQQGADTLSLLAEGPEHRQRLEERAGLVHKEPVDLDQHSR